MQYKFTNGVLFEVDPRSMLNGTRWRMQLGFTTTDASLHQDISKIIYEDSGGKKNPWISNGALLLTAYTEVDSKKMDFVGQLLDFFATHPSFDKADVGNARKIFGITPTAVVSSAKTAPAVQKTFEQEIKDWIAKSKTGLEALGLEKADFDVLEKAKGIDDLEYIKYGIAYNGEYSGKVNFKLQNPGTIFDDLMDAAKGWKGGKTK